MKFKVGDRVRVVPPKDEDGRRRRVRTPTGWASEMDNMLGMKRISVISAVDDPPWVHIIEYGIKYGEYTFWFLEEWLELDEEIVAEL